MHERISDCFLNVRMFILPCPEGEAGVSWGRVGLGQERLGGKEALSLAVQKCYINFRLPTSLTDL